MKKRLMVCMLAFTMLVSSMPAMVSAGDEQSAAAFSSSGTEIQTAEESQGQQPEFSAQELSPGNDEAQGTEAEIFTDGSTDGGIQIEEAEQGMLLSASQYMVARLRLPVQGQPGQYDDTADLSGLSFDMYEENNTNPEGWAYKNTAVSSYDQHYNLYKIDFNYVGNAVKKYKVVLKDNPFYEMQDTVLSSTESFVPENTFCLLYTSPSPRD